MGDQIPTILYVCVHNAGRSQMAAGLTRKLGGDRVRVRSAGSEPGATINPMALEAMSEVGIVLDDVPKLLETDAVREADVIVTMGCGDACPVFPGKRYEDWKLEDPAGKDLETVRAIRDEIQEHVTVLLRSLGIGPH